MKRIIVLICLFPCLTISAQKIITTYYDYNRTHKHEVYGTDNYGTKNGAYTEYSEYGGVLTTGTFKNGSMVGKWVGKDDKGKLLEEVTYDNDGKYNGQRNRYKDGYKYAEENYKHGIPSGHWKVWFDAHGGSDAEMNGVWLKADGTTQLQYDEYYKPCAANYDKRVCLEGYDLDSTKKEYNLDGVLISKIDYKMGLKNGKATYYDIDGSGFIIEEATYQNDDPIGEWRTTWDNQGHQLTLYGNSNTRKKSNASYYKIKEYGNNGKVCKVANYYMTGVKENEGAFVEGIGFVGQYKEYYESGQIYRMGKYTNNGREDSIWNYYAVSGKDSASVKYINGELASKVMEQHGQDSLNAIANKKNQELAESAKRLNYEISRQPIVIDSLYKIFSAKYCIAKESKFLVYNGKPVITYSYPNGKHLFQKADTLCKSWNKEYQKNADVNAKLLKGRNIIVLLKKLNDLASNDADELDKQLKKAETLEDIAKVLSF
jgi:antitoxin component YwqK of YwqJK toxin-antitoxin module